MQANLHRWRSKSEGIADFQALRRELRKEEPEKLTYYVFGLLC